LLAECQPPRTARVVESFVMPAGLVHDAQRFRCADPAVDVYVREKGKVLATPAS